MSVELFLYIFAPKSPIFDPLGFNGAWAVAPNEVVAVKTLAQAAGWEDPGLQKTMISIWKDYVPVKAESAFTDFKGDLAEWNQAVNFGIISREKVVFLPQGAQTVDAIIEARLAQAAEERANRPRPSFFSRLDRFFFRQHNRAQTWAAIGKLAAILIGLVLIILNIKQVLDILGMILAIIIFFWIILGSFSQNKKNEDE